MKRIVVMVCAVIGLAASSGVCQASWGACCYSGYQPWWNIFAKRYKCLTPEEERLQKFWHDYYDAMQNFYGALDHIDWVAYYKNHGYQINGMGGGSGGRINYAPVFVNPSIQWAVPAGAAGGPPIGPPYAMGNGYAPPMGGMTGFPMNGGAFMGPNGAYPNAMYPGTPVPSGPTPNPLPTPAGSGGQ